jgi:hypothetical protein
MFYIIMKIHAKTMVVTAYPLLCFMGLTARPNFISVGRERGKARALPLARQACCGPAGSKEGTWYNPEGQL